MEEIKLGEEEKNEKILCWSKIVVRKRRRFSESEKENRDSFRWKQLFSVNFSTRTHTQKLWYNLVFDPRSLSFVSIGVECNEKTEWRKTKKVLQRLS